MLDLLDRKIIYALDTDARQSTTALAKRLRVAKETVNFRIHRLLDTGVVKGFYPLFDGAVVGQFYKLFIKFKQLSPERRKEILDGFARYPQMSQVLLLEGMFDVQLFYLAKDHKAVLHLLHDINTLCGKEIYHKEILIVDVMYRFPMNFVHAGTADAHAVSGSTEKQIRDIEHAILKQLSLNARASLQDIATATQSSSQLILYHLRKLVKDQTIISTHVAINYDTLGMNHYHLAFQVSDMNVLPSIIEFFKRSKKSLFATTTLGCYDGSAEIIVENSAELRLFIDEFNKLFSETVTRLDVMLIYKEYELRLYPL